MKEISPTIIYQLFEQLDSALIDKTEDSSIHEILSQLLQDECVRIWMSRCRPKAEITLEKYISSFAYKRRWKKLLADDKLFPKFFYLIHRNELAAKYASAVQRRYLIYVKHHFRWTISPELIALKQECLMLPIVPFSIFRTPGMEELQRLFDEILYKSNTIEKIIKLLPKVLTPENIKLFMIIPKLNNSAQDLMELIRLSPHKGISFHWSTPFGKNFARLVYFIDHDLEDGKLNGPGVLMTPGNGIDIIFQETDTSVKDQFKQYMGTIFYGFRPSSKDKILINEIKTILKNG